MATYGSGIKIAGLVNANRSSTGTIYTVPAGNYATLNWSLINGSGGSSTIETGGSALASAGSSVSLSSINANPTNGGGGGPLWVGPAQTINTTISGTATAYVNGPLFSN